VSVANFLRMAVNATRDEPIKIKDFGKLLRQNMELLRIDPEFNSRYLNEGFSGGEKKRAEILQLAMLKPQIAVLDETDSGLDIDALRIVADGVNALRGPKMGTLIITHYTRILQYVRPDFVHIMLDGRIVREGGPELADELEEKGYDFIRAEVTANAG
jgi:Fe-S cluster assembly ATP-binding protein